MKKLLLTLFLFSSPANATFYNEEDKRHHTQGLAVGANLLKSFGATSIEAFSAALLVGIAKELSDNNSASEHKRDMLANIIGASTVFVWEIEF